MIAGAVSFVIEIMLFIQDVQIAPDTPVIVLVFGTATDDCMPGKVIALETLLTVETDAIAWFTIGQLAI